MHSFTVADFEPLVGQPFALDYPARAEVLTLVRVIESPIPPVRDFERGYSLIFGGERRDVMLPQSTWRLRHATLGELDIFLVPIGRLPAGNFQYQAVFG